MSTIKYKYPKSDEDLASLEDMLCYIGNIVNDKRTNKKCSLALIKKAHGAIAILRLFFILFQFRNEDGSLNEKKLNQIQNSLIKD